MTDRRRKQRCAASKRYRLKHIDMVKEYERKYRAEHPKEIRKLRKEYRAKHLEYFKAYNKEWRLKHPEQTKEYQEKKREYNKKWNLTHPEKTKVALEKWKKNNPEKAKELNAKYHAKRRHLGFVPLNKPFLGAHRHHIDNNRVVYIPQEMHKKNWHSLLRNLNMEKINRLAFDFLNGG